MKIGINLPSIPDTKAIEKWLISYEEAGFETVEFDAGLFPMIIGGKLERRWIKVWEQLLSKHNFIYTMHIGYGIDLRSKENFEIHKNALFSSIEAASETGCILLNLHYEKKSDDASIESRFLDSHIEAAEFAEKKGIKLAIENIEVEFVDPVIDFVKKVNKKNFVMNYDIGHGYLASSYLGFDFLDSVKKAAPLLGHLHISGNTGSFEPLRITNRAVYDSLPMGYRIAVGSGDIHVPPLWGSIPYKEIFTILKDYNDIVLCEFYAELFKPFLKEIREETEKLIIATSIKQQKQ